MWLLRLRLLWGLFIGLATIFIAYTALMAFLSPQPIIYAKSSIPKDIHYGGDFWMGRIPPPLNACLAHYCWEFNVSVPAQAIAIIQKFEGLRLKAYRDGAGVLTYGFGHTGLDVAEGLEITLSQADYLLNLDAQKAMDAVLRHVKVPLNDNQLSALISFVFNVGEGHLLAPAF